MTYRVTLEMVSNQFFNLPDLLKRVAQAHPNGFSVAVTDGPNPKEYATWEAFAEQVDTLDFDLVSEARVIGPDFAYSLQFWANEQDAEQGFPNASSILIMCNEDTQLTLDEFSVQINACLDAWKQALDAFGYIYESDEMSNVPSLTAV